MMKFIVNNNTDALKTDVKLFFMITNCQIVRSRSLMCRINYDSICLFSYRQWKLANERSRNSAVVVKIYIASGPSGGKIQNLTVILILAVSVKIIIAERKLHFWYFVSINKAELKAVLIQTFIMWLAPRAGKMTPIARCDWATRAGKMEPSCPLGTTRCFPQEKFDKSFIDQVCSVKLQVYWPRLRLGP